MLRASPLVDIVVPQKNEIDFFWPHFIPLIEKTFPFAGGEHDLEDIKNKWENAQQIFIAFYEEGELLGIASMEFIPFPKKTIVNLPIVSGRDIHKWMDVGLEKISELGKKHGACEIRTRGREGWERMLRKKQFTHEYTILSRKIT